MERNKYWVDHLERSNSECLWEAANLLILDTAS